MKSHVEPAPGARLGASGQRRLRGLRRLPHAGTDQGTAERRYRQAGLQPRLDTCLPPCTRTIIAITGAGVIDGGGRFFATEDLSYILRMPEERPFTVFFLGCDNVAIRDVTIRDGALWTLRLSGCTDVLIHGVRIDNDPAGCRTTTGWTSTTVAGCGSATARSGPVTTRSLPEGQPGDRGIRALQRHHHHRLHPDVHLHRPQPRGGKTRSGDPRCGDLLLRRP